MSDGDAAFLTSYLRDRDTACPGCGYNLRGLTKDVCPECQQQLTLRVGLTEPKFKLWLTAMIGASCGAGFNVLLFTYFLIIIATDEDYPPDYWTLAAPLVGIPALFFLCLLWALLAFGRGIRRASVRARVHIVLVVWILVVVNLVVFASKIR
jgi:hypothetical protein